MIGRRSFMAALGMAPIAAKEIAETAENDIFDFPYNAVSPADEMTPQDSRQNRMREFVAMEQDARDQARYEFHKDRIMQMKSWGLPFREHVYTQNRLAQQKKDIGKKRAWDMTPEELTQAAIKAGWNKIKE